MNPSGFTVATCSAVEGAAAGDQTKRLTVAGAIDLFCGESSFGQRPTRSTMNSAFAPSAFHVDVVLPPRAHRR
jgi:hypothetical protein